MLQDTYVDTIESYLLGGSQNDLVALNDITETWVFYNGGADVYVIDGGYLDIGIYDTMYDLLIATLGTVIAVVIVTFSYFFYPKINRELLPHLVDRRVPVQPESEKNTAETAVSGTGSEADAVETSGALDDTNATNATNAEQK